MLSNAIANAIYIYIYIYTHTNIIRELSKCQSNTFSIHIWRKGVYLIICRVLAAFILINLMQFMTPF